jgi:hypothetical protein
MSVYTSRTHFRYVRVRDGNHGQAVIGVDKERSGRDEGVGTVETGQGWSLMVVGIKPRQQWNHRREIVVSNFVLQRDVSVREQFRGHQKDSNSPVSFL